MQVNSSTYINQTYNTTQPKTFYQSNVQNQSSNRLDKMEQKYKDIFTPLNANSKQNAQKADLLISQKYPFHLTSNEQMLQNMGYIKEIGVSEQSFEKSVQNTKSKLQTYENLDEQTKKEYEEYKTKINSMYPHSVFSSPIEQSKEATNFYNGAVYEALEMGYGIDEAKQLAQQTTIRYMPKETLAIEKMEQIFYDANPNIKRESNYGENSVKQTYANENVKKYGFQNGYYLKKDDNYLANAILEKAKTFQFFVNNPDIYDELNKNDTKNNNISTQENLQNIKEKYLPMAKLASKVFSNYNVYSNSVDLKA